MHRAYFRTVAVFGLAAFASAMLLAIPVGAATPIVDQADRPARAVIAPALSAQPGAITFTSHVSFAAILTRTIYVSNSSSTDPITWTVAVDPAGVLQPVVAPLSGVDAATLSVQIDTSPFTVTGTYTGSIIISAQPSSTPGSPITISISLIITDQLKLVYLPLLARDHRAALPPPIVTTTQFGFDFISSAEARAAEIRYQRAAEAGATVNRWPFYWYAIEQNPLTQPGVFSWAWQDENTINDISHGLTIDAILLGTPPDLSTGGLASLGMPQIGPRARLWHEDALGAASLSGVASPPQGLYLSVFTDGTDIPGPDKSINPSNPWARFVYAAVDRYRPGGVLARQQGWTSGQGIRVWEIWNEPDLSFFFSGTVSDYARMLKVAFLAARHADPNAQILFGGLANFEKPDWLRDTLNVIVTYPDRDANEWFFDSIATHNYSWAWRTFYHLYRARLVLDSLGLTDKTLWLNETGVSVCDDPPGPSCSDPVHKTYRAAPQEQAAYIIQTATFAVWLRAEAMLVFQLYDDFGNGCPGIDAYGLVRNVPAAPCNPGDGTPRPAYHAYQVVTRYLSGLMPYWRRRPTVNQELVALQNQETGERVISMWARDYVTETVTITATASSAVLVYPDGITETIASADGVYTLTLPMATNMNTPTTDGKAPIGGPPRILIEHDPAIVTTP